MPCVTDPDDENARLAAARDLYEGTHGMTMAELSAETGISKRALSSYAREQGWAKAQETKTGATTEAARLAAEKFRAKSFDVALADPGVDDRARVLTDPLPAKREELLKRHRSEWVAPRAMSSEAVRLRNTDPFRAFDRAKLAKITAETLKIVQDGERKAFGIDVPVEPGDGKHVIIIERD